MIRSAKDSEGSKNSTHLLIKRAEAEGRIEEHLAHGESLLNLEILSKGDLGRLKEKKQQWFHSNIELLGVLFDGNEIAKEYSASRGGGVIDFMKTPSLGQQVASVHSDIKIELTKLRALLRRLESFLEPEEGNNQPDSNDVSGEQKYMLEAIVEILEERGILNRQQIFDKIKKIKNKLRGKGK